MNFNLKINNPLLVGAIQLMKMELNKEHQDMFMQELSKATLLMPVRVSPEPEVGENGEWKVADGAQLQFPSLPGKDGVRFMVVYTDLQAMETKDENGKDTTPEEFRKTYACVSFDELAHFILSRGPEGQPSPYIGFVLNPASDNLIVGREQVGYIVQTKIRAMQEAQAGQADNPKNVIRFPKKPTDGADGE